jgi:hypothetical protein
MHISITIALITSLAGVVAAWGGLGHQTVAYLAYKYLTPETRAYLDNILVNDRGFDFADAAVWADAIREGRPYSKVWHFVGEFLFLLSSTN